MQKSKQALVYNLINIHETNVSTLSAWDQETEHWQTPEHFSAHLES